jgi:hypothetical protein
MGRAFFLQNGAIDFCNSWSNGFASAKEQVDLAPVSEADS